MTRLSNRPISLFDRTHAVRPISRGTPPLAYGLRGLGFMIGILLLYAGFLCNSKSRVVASVREGRGQLEDAMTKEQVLEFLGTPYDTDTISDTVAIWKYRYSMSLITPQRLNVVFNGNTLDSVFLQID